MIQSITNTDDAQGTDGHADACGSSGTSPPPLGDAVIEAAFLLNDGKTAEEATAASADGGWQHRRR